MATKNKHPNDIHKRTVAATTTKNNNKTTLTMASMQTITT